MWAVASLEKMEVISEYLGGSVALGLASSASIASLVVVVREVTWSAEATVLQVAAPHWMAQYMTWLLMAPLR